MLKPKKNYLKWIIISLTIFVKIFTNIRIRSDAATLQYTQEQYDQLIRFGITAPLGVVGYDLSEIHALTYLDWAKESSSVPDGVEYIHVLKMRFIEASKDPTGDIDENLFQQFLIDLPNLISRNTDAVWIIGNEPDRIIYQDDLTPEKYAERFYEVATIIKSTDSTARVGFGSVVQPTPIRIRYLERSLLKLADLAGSMELALEMIDLWSIHSFILNEVGTWGADIPTGFDCNVDNCDDAVKISDYADTYNIDIFRERITNFREWLNSISETNKPLWITEYGSLFPDWEIRCKYHPYPDCSNPSNGWPTEKDNNDYMISTFDYLLHSYDSAAGLPDDGYKLVQRWYWYSLNDHLYSFGGSLFDPDNNKLITKQGIAYKQYVEFLINPKIYLPIILN